MARRVAERPAMVLFGDRIAAGELTVLGRAARRSWHGAGLDLVEDGGDAGGHRAAAVALDPLSSAPDRGDERDAGAVGEVDVARRFEQDRVGAGAGREVADVGAAQR